MKEGIHPDNYRTVIFKDLTADWRFLGKSCAESKESEQWEHGRSNRQVPYPLREAQEVIGFCLQEKPGLFAGFFLVQGFQGAVQEFLSGSTS